jgi:hypothetical protein
MSNLSDKPEYAPRPAWVKWLVIAAVVLLLVAVVALLAGGKHGPGRHLSHASGAGVGHPIQPSVTRLA